MRPLNFSEKISLKAIASMNWPKLTDLIIATRADVPELHERGLVRIKTRDDDSAIVNITADGVGWLRDNPF